MKKKITYQKVNYAYTILLIYPTFITSIVRTNTAEMQIHKITYLTNDYLNRLVRCLQTCLALLNYFFDYLLVFRCSCLISLTLFIHQTE